MSSPRERHRNNVRTGVFMSVAILLAVAVIAVLSDAWTHLSRATHPYTVTFRVLDGIGNLRPGAEVRVGGVPMGSVRRVAPMYDTADAIEKIEVEMRLDARVRLYRDAVVQVRAPLIGSDGWIEIPSVGGNDAVVEAGERLTGARTAGMIDAFLGAESAQAVNRLLGRLVESETLLAAIVGPEQEARFGRIMSNADDSVVQVRDFTAWLAGLPEEYRVRIVPILDDAGETVRGTRAFVRDFTEVRWPVWSVRIDETVDGFAEGVDRAGELVSTIGAVIDENREGVRSIVTGTDDLISALRTDSLERLNLAFDAMGDLIGGAESLVRQVDRDYPQWSSHIGETLGGFSLAAQQAKLALIEIRRSPWKVLYQPGARELEHEFLYEAARSFALAAGELKAATAGAERMLERYGDRLAEDPELLRQLTRQVSGPMTRLETAQRTLFDLILASPQSR